MNTNQGIEEIRSIAYNDSGVPFKDKLIVLHTKGDVGRLFKIESDGTRSRSLCPCCMVPSTHKRIMKMILDSRITRVTWESSYGNCASKYMPGLYGGKKLGDGEDEEYVFQVRRDED